MKKVLEIQFEHDNSYLKLIFKETMRFPKKETVTLQLTGTRYKETVLNFGYHDITKAPASYCILFFRGFFLPRCCNCLLYTSSGLLIMIKFYIVYLLRLKNKHECLII